MPDKTPPAVGPRGIILLTIALLLITALVALSMFRLRGPQIEREAFTNLEITARLKAERLEEWLAERHGDGQVMMRNFAIIDHIATLDQSSRAGDWEETRLWLESVRDAYNYRAVLLLDKNGKPRLTLGEKHTLPEATSALIGKALATGEIQRGELSLEKSEGERGLSHASLDFVVPLRQTVAGKKQPVGVVILHTDPHSVVFPMIRDLPVDTASGEVLLVAKEGAAVMFLNTPRHLSGQQSRPKVSLSQTDAPVAVALHLDEPGNLRGVDYRGAEVFAAFRPVRGTEWRVVAKIDTHEVLAPLWRLILWVSLLVLLTLGAIGATLLALWRQQQHARRLAGQVETARLLAESEARFRAAATTAGDALVTADSNGMVVDWNPAAEKMFGFSTAEITGQSLALIIPPRFRERAMAGFAQMMQGDPQGHDGKRIELIGLRKDGSELRLERTVALWATNAGRFYTCTMRDIGERRQAEEANRRLQIENESILRNVQVGIVYLRHRQVISCNQRFEEILGYLPGELIGQSTERFFPSHEQFIEIGQRAYLALERGEKFSEETLLKRKDGSLFWGALTGRAIDPEKVQEGSIWIYADISERRLAEQEAKKLLQAVEQAPVSIVITDTQGIIEYVNPSFSRITGFSRREAVGQNPRILQSGETAPEIYQAMWQCLTAGNTWQGTLRNRCKDGRLIWEETSISPIVGDDGALTHFIAIKEDVTERKRAETQTRESEEAFRRLFEDVGDPILLIRDGCFIDCNNAAVALLGYQSKTEFLNQTPDALSPTLQPDGQLSADKAALQMALALEFGYNRFEWLHLRADGSTVPIEVTLTALTLRGERILHTLWRDITEQKRIENELEDHRAHLENLVAQRTAELSEALNAARVADQAKDAFLANISHELRTPLSAMIGFSSLARPLSANERQRDYLDKIVSAGKTLTDIINDLLDLSKIAAGSMALEATTFSLRSVISRSLSVMAYRAEEKNLQMIEHIDAGVPDILLGDTLRLEQILMNLLSNAIKFTAAGQITTHVALQYCTAEHACLQIEVTDTGIGMREADLALLFKPFSQTDVSISRKFGGTGLGLAICKQLANLMDGDIVARSSEGHGTTFCVTLCFGLGQADDLPLSMPSGDDTSALRYEDARILVVDDQPFNREVVEGLLAVVGIRPILACNGEEALTRVLSEGVGAFDLVLMDIQMPVMDGLSATRELRKRPEFDDLPVIAMTAHTMAHENAISSAAGMNDRIGKPFNEASFYGVLAKWMPAAKHRISTRPAPPGTPASPTLQLRGIDTQAGLALLLGDEMRYRHWLSNFIEEGPGHLRQIAQALAAGQHDEAALTAHVLKGRSGMLGMGELHVLSTALEAALERGEPVHALQIQLAQSVEALCAEIATVLGLPQGAAAEPETAAQALPEGAAPDCVQQLIAMLEAGHSDSDRKIAECLDDLADTLWAPHLEHALLEVQNFDFAAASKRLSQKGPQCPPFKSD